MIVRPCFAAVVLAARLSTPAAAQDREEILSYDVVVDVQPDGQLVVNEEITVTALGEEIRRGIYRDFPTRFPKGNRWTSAVAPFDVLAVLREGQPEPYELLSIGGPAGRGGVRVRIGDPDVFLPSGVHQYTLTYATERWLTFGEDADQLYWNVTGNGWGFAILSASAQIVLPGTVDPERVRLEAWTGPVGSTEEAAARRWDPSAADGGAAVFRTTRALRPEEGLTIRVTFPKGLVAPPTPEKEAEWFRMEWGPYIDGAVVVALILLLYFLMWLRVGMDPARRPVMVQYEPPEGFSPAELGFLKKRGYDHSLLASALVSLAVKGALRIDREGSTWSVARTYEVQDSESISKDERAVLSALLPDRSELKLKQKHHRRIQKAVRAFRKALSRRLEREYFVTNRRWFLSGLALSLAGFGALTWRARYSIAPEGWFFGFFLTFWTLGVAVLLVWVWRAWSQALSGAVLSWVEAIFATLFATPFFLAEVFVAYALFQFVPRHLVAAALVLGVVNALFYHLLERPTLKGRGILDRLEGFTRFLTATDADRLDRMTPPERTPELFEQYLPHAIALGVENRWAKRFENALVPEAPGGSGTSRTPMGWYGGPASGGFSSFSSSLGSSLASTLSASSASPSSGGGGSGGGGGSSGGGGGGGGGGGW
jgi:uncharacterized membrane protein YgcG